MIIHQPWIKILAKSDKVAQNRDFLLITAIFLSQITLWRWGYWFRRIPSQWTSLSAVILCQFWWWLSGDQEGKKSTEKGNFWPFFDFFTPWFAIKVPQKFQTLLTTRVRHLNAKFAVDSIDPTQLIARGAEKSMDFWDFSVKIFFLTSSNDATFFAHLEGWKVSTGGHAQSCQVQKGVLNFIKNIHWHVSKKFPFSNFFFPFRN